ncbi:MAG: aldo/keto reductase, partial [Candidatus Omnitrophica bacterium]|nr:aldo/keto reductase [Candidatus Omnitrophota bacterium]
QMRMYLPYFDIECLQPRYSMLSREIEDHELPLCLEKRIGAIAYSPLHRGLLTGKYSKDHTFEDTRKDAPLFTGRAFHRILDALAEVQPIASDLGLTVPQLAIRWVLTHPAMTCAIVGIKNAEHLATICPAADENLPIEVWHKVSTILANAKKEAEAM